MVTPLSQTSISQKMYNFVKNFVDSNVAFICDTLRLIENMLSITLMPDSTVAGFHGALEAIKDLVPKKLYILFTENMRFKNFQK